MGWGWGWRQRLARARQARRGVAGPPCARSCAAAQPAAFNSSRACQPTRQCGHPTTKPKREDTKQNMPTLPTMSVRPLRLIRSQNRGSLVRSRQSRRTMAARHRSSRLRCSKILISTSPPVSTPSPLSFAASPSITAATSATQGPGGRASNTQLAVRGRRLCYATPAEAPPSWPKQELLAAPRGPPRPAPRYLLHPARPQRHRPASISTSAHPCRPARQQHRNSPFSAVPSRLGLFGGPLQQPSLINEAARRAAAARVKSEKERPCPVWRGCQSTACQPTMMWGKAEKAAEGTPPALPGTFSPI